MYFSGIIREEELERINQLETGDDWARDDDMDYNPKVVYSDDDSDAALPQLNRNKRLNFNDKEREIKALQQRRDEENRAGKFSIFFKFF